MLAESQGSGPVLADHLVGVHDVVQRLGHLGDDPLEWLTGTAFAEPVVRFLGLGDRSDGAAGVLISPFWFTLEGALVGLLIGYAATRFGGEGKETVGR